MIRLLLSFIIAILGSVVAIAQSADSADHSQLQFSFHYIAHDETTPVSAIIEKLQVDYYNAVEDEDYPHPTVFYLSSGARPIIVRINLPNDNRDDFDNVLLPELYQRNAHEVEPETDIEELNRIFDEIGLVTDTNRLRYSSARFNFYINPQFWKVNNNEKIIASLFMGLDIPDMEGNLIEWNIYQPTRHHITYSEGKPFGDKNVSNINDFTKGKIYEIGE